MFAQACFDGNVSIEAHGDANTALWGLAHSLGVGTEVSFILQGLSLAEMDEFIH